MPGRVLVAGATGFIGRYVRPVLRARGWTLRCGSRRGAAADSPDEEWVFLDLNSPQSVAAALQGCDAALYLVHSISGNDAYPVREAHAAQVFQHEAACAGLKRIVYLGAVEPQGKASRHLASRLKTGAILRAGKVPTIELRSAMVIGAGGSSWAIVRDLAARLPAMLLPKWLNFVSWPVAIDDVVFALVHALEMSAAHSLCYDLPGAEALRHAALLSRVATAMQRKPALISVPVLSPRLSSYWIAMVTRAPLPLIKELVQGLQSDLHPTGELFWSTQEGVATSLDLAIAQALQDEKSSALPSAAAIERLLERCA